MRRLVAALSVSGTMYCRCAACGYAGCAWPAPLSAAVEQKRSTPNHGVERLAILCIACGGGGGRTRVQTRNPRAFYMFSRPFGPSIGARQAAAKPRSQPLCLVR